MRWSLETRKRLSSSTALASRSAAFAFWYWWALRPLCFFSPGRQRRWASEADQPPRARRAPP
eukprot:5931175-Pyramimonas_sp.AAC.1